ncbi:hypothetical protein A5687_20635 [Mycobacterium mantenii]|nr:hypothetical protein A5687_20635 [Mycobacterium mantenii]
MCDALAVAHYCMNIDVIVACREVGVAQTVVVFGFRTAEQFTAAASATEQEFNRLCEARLALAIAGVHNHQGGIKLQKAGFGAEGPKTTNL